MTNIIQPLRSSPLLPRRLHLAVLALAALAPTLACDAPDVAAHDDAPDLADDADDADADSERTTRIDALVDGEIRVHGTPIADLTLPRGPRLVFIDLAAPDEPPAIGVYEHVPTGHVGTENFSELVGAAPLELFRAATTADVSVPPRLQATASADLADAAAPRARGWLIPAVADALLPRSTCTNSEFMDVVESFGYHDMGTPTFRLDEDPATSVFFEPWDYNFYPQMAVSNAYTYILGNDPGSLWSNIDGYYTRVAVCDLGSHPQTCGVGGCVSHPGPTVNIAFRDDDNEPFSFETVVNHDFSGTGFSKWHWFTGSNWDWRTRIEIAEEGDLFDIGHAVQVD